MLIALLNAGAKINVKDNLGLTPLHIAAQCIYTSEIDEKYKILIDAGAKINSKDNKGRNALHHAVESEIIREVEKYSTDAPSIESLIIAGIDVNAEDIVGWTPLHLASYHLMTQYNGNGQQKIFPDDNGENRMNYVVPDQNIVRKLIKGGANVNALVEIGLDINLIGRDGGTILHWIAKNGHTLAVKNLFNIGADMEVRDELGRTPLQLASYFSHVETVKFLRKIKNES